jgi:TP901 family phage tail tape measure protein
MADFEKVYSIKFETSKAERSLEKIDKSLEGIQKETKEAGKKFQKWMGRTGKKSVDDLNKKLQKTKISLKNIRGGLDKVARKLAIASAAFAGLGAISIKSALELNKSMANVSTLLSGNVEDVKKLKTSVQNMAKATGKSTTDLADGLYDVVSALGESTDNVKQLGIAAKASVAGISTTKEAIGLLTATTKGYGDSSVEAMRKVSDLAFQTVKLGVTTFPELAASMGRVIPLAAAMETSQEELFGTMATLTGVTGNAAEVSTQLASVYSAFLKPSEKMTEAAKKLGFETAGAMMKSLGFRKSLLALNDAVDGNEGKLAKMLKRKEALVGALALLGGQSDKYVEKLNAMEEAVGATDEAFQKQTEGINKQGHSWEKTKRRLEVFAQRAGDKLLPILGKILDKLEPFLKYLENMSEETMESWIQFGKWVAILAVATKSLSGLLGVVETIGSFRGMIQGLSGVSGGLSAVAGKANAAKSAMLGFKVGGVAAAAAVGLAIGTMLTDIFLAPQQKKRYRQQDTLFETAVKGQSTARKLGAIQQKEKELADLRAKRAKFRAEAGNVGFAEVMGGIVAPFTGRMSPGEMRGKIYKETDAAIQALEGSISEAKQAEWRGIQSEYGIAPMGRSEGAIPRQSQGQQITVNNPVNVTVTTAGGDAPGIGRSVKQEMKKRDREMMREIKQAARQMAAGEE